MKNLLSEQEISWLKDNYYNLGAFGCAQHLNKTPLQIRTFIKSRRLKLLASKEARTKPSGRPRGKKLDDYQVNPKQFFNIATPEVAYILGLLWADGYIYANETKRAYKVVLETLFDDAIVFQRILLKTGNWPFYERDRSNMRKQGRSVCFNEPLVRFLIENDYLVKSSNSAEKILSKIPDKLHPYWFRGLLDGDGNISKRDYRVSISSSFEQNWTYMESLCQKLQIRHRISKRISENGNRSEFIISGLRNYTVFLDFIYQSRETDLLGLNRKYDIFITKKENISKCKRKTTWLKNQTAKANLPNVPAF